MGSRLDIWSRARRGGFRPGCFSRSVRYDWFLGAVISAPTKCHRNDFYQIADEIGGERVNGDCCAPDMAIKSIADKCLHTKANSAPGSPHRQAPETHCGFSESQDAPPRPPGKSLPLAPSSGGGSSGT